MIISPNIIRKETVRLLTAVEGEMKKYEDEAEMTGESPFRIVNSAGAADYAMLLNSKLTALNTLALANASEKK